MAKYLLLAVVLYLVYRMFRRPASPPSVPRAEEAQVMIKCAQCGVHLPRSEAVTLGDNSYCCDAHRSLGPRKAS